MNILFSFDTETDNANEQSNNDDINDWLRENYKDIGEYNDIMVSHMVNYTENYTVKDLLLICDYYGFSKELKINRRNKQQIINFLVSFETDSLNSDIVCKRKNMWFYVNELKNDKFMKKYVLW
jgi:capsular polysaccharide biosynthesis protein